MFVVKAVGHSTTDQLSSKLLPALGLDDGGTEHGLPLW